jgi:hypothetical protein
MRAVERKEYIMKIIYRTFIILLAAGLVCVGLYLAVGSSSPAFTAGDRPARAQFDSGTAPSIGGRLQAPIGDFRPERRDEGGSIEGIFGLFGSLLKIAVITVFVLLVQWLGRKAGRRPASRQTG